MNVIVHPPLRRFRKPSHSPTVFLAGSIEMGGAAPWHDLVAEKLSPASLIYNPRRTEWDASWEQTITAENFNVQVNWELDMIDIADAVFVYFEPGTKSPISLLELGIVSVTKPDRTVVVCPDGFWRQGNVEIVCERAGIVFVKDIEDGIKAMAPLLNRLLR